jgi:hypothetical protein
MDFAVENRSQTLVSHQLKGSEISTYTIKCSRLSSHIHKSVSMIGEGYLSLVRYRHPRRGVERATQTSRSGPKATWAARITHPESAAHTLINVRCWKEIAFAYEGLQQ